LATLLNDIKTILIIRCGALGDLIYATAVIDALRMQYGEAVEIDFVSTPGPGSIFQKDERVRKVYPLQHRKVPALFSKDKQRVIRHSKESPYDLLINLEMNKHFDVLSKKIHARHKVGSPYTPLKTGKEHRHMVDIIKQIIAPVCEPDILNKAYPRLYGEKWENVHGKYQLPEKYIVFNPSNSHSRRHKINYRAWPQEHWKTLLSKIPSHIPVVIIAGRGEEAYFEKIKPYPDNVIDLTGKTPLIDLISVIEHADAIVTTDTGPAHLASAVNTDIYVLIGPTPAGLTGPYITPDNRVTILSMELPCSPCYNTDVMRNCQDNICMKQITPEMVLKSMQPMLDTF
jgi:ADP-heptose:LPS heptosyltransferase